MSLSATLFGRDSAIHRVTNILGLGIPGLLDKKFGAPDTEGPRLSDLSVQTSTYGAEIPRVYGRIAIAGNLLWLENNKLKETIKKNKSGGKGDGGGSEPTKTYSYSATFAVGICAGEIAGVSRIWCADKLIYNAGSDDPATIIASNQAATGWTLYLGTDDQMPDPRYEANVGAGNASAFRGIAYIVFRDFKLKDYSNTLQAAQFKFEVVASATAATPTYLNSISYAGRPNWAGDGLIQTAEVVSSAPDSFGFTGKMRFSRHSLGSGALVSSEIVSQSIQLGGGSTNPLYYGVRAVNGLQGALCVHRTIGGGAVFLSGADNAIALPDITGSGECCFAGGYYWIAGASNIHKISSSFELVASYPLASGSSRFYIRSDPSTGRIFSKTKLNATNEIIFSEFEDDPSAPLWSQSLGFGFGSDSGVEEFNVDSGMLSVWLFEKLSVYSIGATSVTLAGTGDTVGDLRQPVFSGGPGLSVSGGRIYQHTLRDAVGSAPLDDVVVAECALSALISASDVDASAPSASVRGYRVSGGSIRSGLEPLQTAFPFDVIQSGYQIKFIPRGQSSVLTIPYEDMGATSGKALDEIFQQSREMDPQLPARTVVNYLDAAREYSASEQSSDRINTEAVNKRNVELAIVLNADEAAGIAEMLQWLPWLERTDAAFTLPPTYLSLEPGDVVTAVTPQASYELRITEANYTQDGRVECRALPNRAALYTPAATGGDGVVPDGTIGLPGQSFFLPLDIPVVDETLQDSPGFAGAMTGYTDGWTSATVFRSNDDGQIWTELQGFAGKATIGTARGTLPVSDCTLIDQRSLIVDLISGELESIARDQMLAGVHYVAYGRDGRWEIVRFQDAPLQVDGSYLVSGFVRGEFGTEWATGLHEDGDYFVLLDDPDNAFIGLPIALIGVESDYRGVTAGAAIDSASDVPFAYRGVNLECLSPVYASGTRSAGDLAAIWTRRSRLSSSWWSTGVAAPVGEASESYEVDVMDGSTVVRTIAAGTPTITYTSAQQTTDFGSPQASITLRIYQLSAVVGRGYPLEVTL